MDLNIYLVYGLFFLATLAFAFIINILLLKFSKSLGIRNTGDTIIRWASTSKPALGGISFYIGFLFSIIIIAFLHPSETIFFNMKSFGILVAVTIGFLAGLFDDAYNTRPWVKFFSQLLCGLVLILTGTSITLFSNDYLNYALTLFWVIGMMNSINMLDNMDGITTIVSIGVTLTIIAGILLRGELYNPHLVILFALVAVLLAFLYYNWNPSKMYMGDTGSQFLGVLLAILGIIYFWNGQAFTIESDAWMRFITIAVAFALPITDTTTVFYKRIARGQSPFIGGRDHTTHHLSYLGLTDSDVAVLFGVISLVSLFATISMTHFLPYWNFVHYAFFSGYFLIIFLFLFIVGNMNKERDI